jgi:hypothetical protein
MTLQPPDFGPMFRPGVRYRIKDGDDDPGDPKVPPPRRGAAARLTVRDEPVAAWQPAVRPEYDPAAVRAGQLDGFAVSRGTGAFLDASALAALGPLERAGPAGPGPEMDEVILEVMEKKVVNLVVDRAEDLNVIMFDCGLGAGAYPVWLGRTAAGEPACFVARP